MSEYGPSGGGWEDFRVPHGRLFGRVVRIGALLRRVPHRAGCAGRIVALPSAYGRLAGCGVVWGTLRLARRNVAGCAESGGFGRLSQILDRRLPGYAGSRDQSTDGLVRRSSRRAARLGPNGWPSAVGW